MLDRISGLARLTEFIVSISSESLAIDRFSGVLFASFGALGLLLAAVGIVSGVARVCVSSLAREPRRATRGAAV